MDTHNKNKIKRLLELSLQYNKEIENFCDNYSPTKKSGSQTPFPEKKSIPALPVLAQSLSGFHEDIIVQLRQLYEELEKEADATDNNSLYSNHENEEVYLFDL